MNRITTLLILLFTLALPAVSAGEGTTDLSPAVESALPVTRVTLYTAGLAHMVHETTVTGDGILSFPVEQSDLNDLLKSLVVEDLGGGAVEAVSFDSGDPLAAALAGMRVNPMGSPGLVEFLERTQGELVTAMTPYGSFSGRIFSVEEQPGEEIPQRILNLMDPSGLRAVDISLLQSLRFDDPALQQELNHALSLIAQSRVKSTRLLQLRFRGEGTRTVRLSYIKAVPLWKTSYRIVLDSSGVPRLEGWALVQNTGGTPWTDVALGFVAGSPNAFTMDLSTPRYVPRQEVAIASAAPVGATEYDRGYAPEAPMMAKEYNRGAAPAASALLNEELEEMYGDFYAEEESYEPAPTAPRATGTRGGNFYRYQVKTPVTVGARSSAMIPIIQEEGVGSPLALYDPSHGLVFKGLRLKNGSDAHWAAGPVTILEGRYYGGDALLPEMIPQGERLLTYAVHGTLEVEKSLERRPQEISRLTIADGLLLRTDKILRETVYRITGTEKELILIHPKETGWELTEHPPLTEETGEEYRFSPESWEAPVLVKEEYLVSRQYSLYDFGIEDFSAYLEWTGLSPGMEEAFREISRLKRDAESIRKEIQSLNSRITRRERDQNRVRENMKVLDKESDLYIRYASQLSRQEEEIQGMNARVDEQQILLQSADQALRDYILSLDL